MEAFATSIQSMKSSMKNTLDCFFPDGLVVANPEEFFNPLSVNPTKWSNTLKQFVGCCFECV